MGSVPAEAVPAAGKPHPGSRGRGSGKPRSPGTWGSSRCGFSPDFNDFWVIFVCFGFTTCGKTAPLAQGQRWGCPGLRGPGAPGGEWGIHRGIGIGIGIAVGIKIRIGIGIKVEIKIGT